MESLGIQARPAPYLQPAHALQGDVAAILREGRVLAGEVLQRMDGGSLLIGIGGNYRVAANSRAELQPGDRFEFQVERRGDGAQAGELVLRVLEGDARDSLLLRVLRSRTPGTTIDLGLSLEQLGQTLRQAGPLAERLLSSLASGAFAAERGAAQSPADAATALRAALSFGGARHEASLLQAALQQLPTEGIAVELSSLLLERAIGADAQALVDPAGQAVAQAAAADLRVGLSLARLENFDLSSILRAVAGQVRARNVPNATAAALRASLAAGLEKIAGGAGGALTESIRRLLRGENSEGVSELDRAKTNHKALLMQALTLPEGEGEGELPRAAREAIARTLRSLESEQLQSALRREVGTIQRFSLPFLASNEVRSAKLWVGEENSSSRGSADSDRADSRTRATVALELSALGPVRVDVLLHDKRVALRALVSTQEAAQSLRAGFESLRARIEAGGHALLGGGVAVVQDLDRLRGKDLDGSEGGLDITRRFAAVRTVLDMVG